jgi:hypothetical protein
MEEEQKAVDSAEAVAAAVEAPEHIAADVAVDQRLLPFSLFRTSPHRCRPWVASGFLSAL